MNTTLNKIRAHGPCTDGWRKLLSYLGKTEADDDPLPITAILDSNGLDNALWCLRAVDGHDREIRLFAVWCARQVQHLMTDPRSIAALNVAERYATGDATDDELAAAWGAAWAAANAAGDAARDARAAADAAWAAVDAARGAAWAAANAARGAAWGAADAAWAAADAASAAARAAAWAAARAAAFTAIDAAWAASDAARDAASSAQANKLREICGGIHD